MKFPVLSKGKIIKNGVPNSSDLWTGQGESNGEGKIRFWQRYDRRADVGPLRRWLKNAELKQGTPINRRRRQKSLEGNPLGRRETDESKQIKG